MWVFISAPCNAPCTHNSEEKKRFAAGRGRRLGRLQAVQFKKFKDLYIYIFLLFQLFLPNIRLDHIGLEKSHIFIICLFLLVRVLKIFQLFDFWMEVCWY